MSTILKALKKAEDGRAKETLPGKITLEDAPEAPARRRPASWILAVLALALVLAAAAAVHYRPLAALLRGGGAAPEPAEPSPAPTPEPAGTAAAEGPPVRLTGIIWDRENPVAIVNGRSLSPGEEVSGARVVKITFDSVVFRRGAEEFTVTMHE